ncbi:MAG: right-handed parallel beta-helix repeat-containing protein, partial [Bacteroidota bacterium]
MLSLFAYSSIAQITCHTPDPLPTGGLPELDCSATSPYFNENFINLPNSNDEPIKININLIFLQNDQGEGNFQEGNPEHDAYIDGFMARANGIYAKIKNPLNCPQGLIEDIKIQFDYKKYYIPNTFYWDFDNCNTGSCCPLIPGSGWYIDPLDDAILNDPNIRDGVNIYYNTSGSLYDDIVVNQSGCDNNALIPNGQCSQSPTISDFNQSQRITAPNAWLIFYYYKNCFTLAPFSATRAQELERNADYVTHEVGHAFALGHNDNDCGFSNMMGTDSDAVNDYLTPNQVGLMHRSLGRTNLRKFIACDQSHQVDQIVSTDETWDFDRRVYSDVVVEEGATLRITCQLLMPLDASIIVQRGARLIIDGGTITRANTCIGDEKWRGIQVHGNNAVEHTVEMLNENSPLQPDNPGIVLIKNSAIIEHAKAAITTNPSGLGWPAVQSYWNGLIHAENSTFRNNVHAIGFMRDDQLDGTENINLSAFIDCDFLNEDDLSRYGITCWEANNVLIDDCTFSHLTESGIIAYDSGLTIKRSTFNHNKHGIELRATAPLSAELTIGGPVVEDGNQFDNNEIGIYSMAARSLNLENNAFSNNFVGFYTFGESEYFLEENTFTSDIFGVGNVQTGKGLKRISCNTYTGNTVGMYNGGET